MKLNFKDESWQSEDIVYASTYRFTETPHFVQCDGWVENAENEGQICNCDNVAVLTRKKYESGTEATAECSFSELSAPLIVIAKDMYEDSGVYKYGDYFEVVIWKHGLNVWRMVMDEDRHVKHRLVLGIDHPLDEAERHTITATVNGDMLEVGVDGVRARVYMGEIYESFHLGINACEGICRFYSFNIEKSSLEPARIGWIS